ncbi:hypothetical protein ACLHDG_06650 [Sulfurovum sp. CS9]|uniref:hypothetical protein n=1 Tax=Sulfurovum sp. CS9 TaxID=3391146 RepID=UPI0039E9E9B8
MNFKDLPFEKAEIEVTIFDVENNDFVFTYKGEPYSTNVPFAWKDLSLHKGMLVDVKKESYTKLSKGVYVERAKLVFLGEVSF